MEIYPKTMNSVTELCDKFYTFTSPYFRKLFQRHRPHKKRHRPHKKRHRPHKERHRPHNRWRRPDN
ncbi:hypothetical protein HZS_595 [Henneguya salminicola]|nr:hypothetical protein HZS_595 [Henneguya salminicola]